MLVVSLTPALNRLKCKRKNETKLPVESITIRVNLVLLNFCIKLNKVVCDNVKPMNKFKSFPAEFSNNVNFNNA